MNIRETRGEEVDRTHILPKEFSRWFFRTPFDTSNISSLKSVLQ